jgi:hypothetical protein
MPSVSPHGKLIAFAGQKNVGQPLASPVGASIKREGSPVPALGSRLSTRQYSTLASRSHRTNIVARNSSISSNGKPGGRALLELIIGQLSHVRSVRAHDVYVAVWLRIVRMERCLVLEAAARPASCRASGGVTVGRTRSGPARCEKPTAACVHSRSSSTTAEQLMATTTILARSSRTCARCLRRRSSESAPAERWDCTACSAGRTRSIRARRSAHIE